MSKVTMAVTIDCAADDVEAAAAFWAAALEYDRVLPGYLVDPAGVQPRLSFEVVPEPKSVKNRWHLDLYVDHLDALQAKVDELVALGATEGPHFDEPAHGYTDVFTTMLDPVGNEFCVCAPHVRVEDGASLE